MHNLRQNNVQRRTITSTKITTTLIMQENFWLNVGETVQHLLCHLPFRQLLCEILLVKLRKGKLELPVPEKMY